MEVTLCGKQFKINIVSFTTKCIYVIRMDRKTYNS
jgi:hypothetical protein